METKEQICENCGKELTKKEIKSNHNRKIKLCEKCYDPQLEKFLISKHK